MQWYTPLEVQWYTLLEVRWYTPLEVRWYTSLGVPVYTSYRVRVHTLLGTEVLPRSVQGDCPARGAVTYLARVCTANAHKNIGDKTPSP